MMQGPIRVGIVGFGMAGRIFHASVIDATPGLEIAAIVQRTGNDAGKLYPSARIVQSVEMLLEDASINLIVIATPNHSHFDLARQCLEAGRAVIVDKPFVLTSNQAAHQMRIGRQRYLLLTVFQSRRWDGDFKTVKQLLESAELGRLVTFRSHYDRFRLARRPGAWREESGEGGGILYDLGSHLIDQALTLFGVPTWIDADIRTEREGFTTDDAFDLHLSYPRLTVSLHATMIASLPGPRFSLRGTEGSYVKYGMDPQEDAIKRGEPVGSQHWGEESEADWGILKRSDGISRHVPTLPGDYRDLYVNVRDALLGKADLAVHAIDGWRTARMIELARASNFERRRVECDLGEGPVA